MSQFFALGGQRIGVSASASVLPMNIQDWFPLGLTAWISLWYWRNWDPEEQTLAQSHRATRVQVWALVWSQGKPILTAVPSEKWCVWSHGIALAQLHPWIFLLPWAWPEISEPNMEVSNAKFWKKCSSWAIYFQAPAWGICDTKWEQARSGQSHAIYLSCWGSAVNSRHEFLHIILQVQSGQNICKDINFLEVLVGGLPGKWRDCSVILL